MLFQILRTVVVTLCCCAAAVRCMHFFQIERYQLQVYSQWLHRNRDRILRENVFIGIGAAMLNWYLPILLSLFVPVAERRNALANWLVLICFVIVSLALAVRDYRLPSKRPFVFTARMRRLLIALTAEYLVLILLFEILPFSAYLTYAVIPYAVWLAGRIMDPVEERINAVFYEEAHRKLRAHKDLLRIGITGSSGKTMTKFILRELLSTKYEVLATPASFNTAMGISRTINEHLESKHQVFIAEMGAHHVGDIRYLAKLVRPQYGVITSIGPQHIESFGSIANIADTKFELIDSLPENGIAFFASDSGYTDRLYSKCKLEKYNATVEQEGSYYMRAAELSVDAKGSHFMLLCSDGGRVHCHTRLLGRYNVQNIVLSAAIAHRMGLTMEEIAAGIGRLQPFEKKLQLVGGKRIVIDDSNNVNPAGAMEALDVLAEFPGRRIVVTPGLPESGSKGEDVNFAFGTQMQDCADAVILVGDKQTVRPILRGLLSVGFPRGSIQNVSDIEDAQELLNEISGPGDTVLYESSIEE